MQAPMLSRFLVIVALFVGGLSICAAGPARAIANGIAPTADAEAYLRQQWLAGEDVDLDARCGRDEARSIGAEDETDTCRTMSGGAFARLLRDKTIATALPAHGFLVAGLHVRGDVDLQWTEIAANVVCRDCRFGGRLLLASASFDRGLRFENCELLGGLDARAAQMRGRVSFADETRVSGGTVDFSTATLSEMLEADRASFDARLDVSKAKLGLVRFADTTFAEGIQADDAVIGGTFTLDDRTRVLGKGLVARGMAVGSYFKFGEKTERGARLGNASEIAGLNLTSARLRAGLEIGDTRVGSASEVVDDERFKTAGLVLVAANIDGALRIDGVTIAGAVDADGATIAKGLQSRRTEYLAEVSFKHASVGGDVEFADRSLSRLTAEKLHVGGSLSLENMRAENLDLMGASIDGDVDLSNLAVTGGREKSDDSLDLGQASIGKHLSLEGATTVTGRANFSGLSTSDLVIGIVPQTPPTSVRFSDEADFSRIKVANSVFMRSVVFAQPLVFVAADIKAHLDIATSEVAKLDMTRASVGGDFRLALRDEEVKGDAISGGTIWSDGAKLVLTNAHVGVVQDENKRMQDKAWPSKVELQGFGYDRFGTPPDYDPAMRWLGRDGSGSGPFTQLAKFYGEAGHKEDADKVLYQSKWNETTDAWTNCVAPDRHACAHAVGLTALWALIGYGIGNGLFRALIWILAFTILGALVLIRTRDENQSWVWWGGPGRGPVWCLGASANHLIPLVELNSEFKKFFDDPKRERLRPGQLAYFAGHAVAGYVLASFVVAAISGLTQSH